MEPARLSERILEVFDDLTRAERLLADHFLESPDSLAMHTAEQLSEMAGVSKATTARFFKRLGFPSFKTAQRMARAGDTDTGQGKRVFSEPIQRRTGRGDLADHLASDVQNLIRTIEGIRSDDLNMAVLNLARAEKIWVVGFGDNYPLAHFARAQLIKIKPDIRMIPIGGFSVPEEFASIRTADTVLALAIGRRSRTFRSILQSAMLAGAQTITLTDHVSAGNPELAHVTLRCRTNGLSYFDSVAAPVSVITYLCMAVAQRIGQTAVERLRYIDSIHTEWDDAG
ncbi:MurR/RpiR family transcriptional regulator [Puniceibacterium sediminis]|uniref:Transcriptional regulator, RpiR family n=1 Tax=Puniceibacterium sediminis TaxID=1608407 RepID=A0A238X3Y9_9RHOB|nr:MurR/RpiR family transcriptional regulator [Puniceibacterium sediminis]SNR53293.1 transcriptional regulator, RpiR family [Puniceibacterium sediminis]